MKIGIIPYVKDDFVVGNDEVRPLMPQFQSTHNNFNKPQDIPLNKRNFIYVPCAPLTDFKELGYCNTEYPFDKPGFNLMDRSDGVSLKESQNDTITVMETMGWRTGRCDVCIKEGTSYWEVEIVKGGSIADSELQDDVLKLKNKIDSSPHIRFGISRREASLEGPVGFDSYGYGIRDQYLESIYDGELSKAIEKDISLKPGDRLGFVLELPNLDTQVEQAKEYTNRRLEALRQSNFSTNNNTNNSNQEEANGPSKKKAKHSKTSYKQFEKVLLEDIEYNNVIRDQIAIRYKNQLFFEATDYIKTTKPEYYSSDRRERQDYYTLEGSCLKVYLNGEYLGKAFENINPFLPPFSELQYNEKFYFSYWKNGESNNEQLARSGNYSVDGALTDGRSPSFDDSTNNNDRHVGLLLRNKYVNNNKLGYYPTVSCFSGGEARIVTTAADLKYFNKIKSEIDNKDNIKSLDTLFMEQVAEDLVWDIIEEVEEECKNIRR